MKMNECQCNAPPFDYRNFQSNYVGMDNHYAEIQIDQCKECGNRWLKYLIEEEHFSKSGRWWRIKLTDDSVKIDKEDARRFIERQTTCFIGGSYFGHSGRLFEGKIEIR